MIDVLLAAFMVCATGDNSNAALDRWEQGGVPIVRTCGDSPNTLYITDGMPPLDWPIEPWMIGATWGKEAYCWAPWGLEVFVCAHEIGHLLGLNHPYEGGRCQGQWHMENPYALAFGNPFALGFIRPEAANPTVMDGGGCPGAINGPYPADIAAVMRLTTR